MSYTREELDAQYDPSSAVSDIADYVRQWRELSATAVSGTRCVQTYATVTARRSYSIISSLKPGRSARDLLSWCLDPRVEACFIPHR